jgi:hypothetical protein
LVQLWLDRLGDFAERHIENIQGKGATVRQLAGTASNQAGTAIPNRSEKGMPETNRTNEQTVRDRAYFIWEREGRPDGRAYDHWTRAIKEAARREPRQDAEQLPDEEKILAGRIDVNLPALLTKDVPGG